MPDEVNPISFWLFSLIDVFCYFGPSNLLLSSFFFFLSELIPGCSDPAWLAEILSGFWWGEDMKQRQEASTCVLSCSWRWWWRTDHVFVMDEEEPSSQLRPPLPTVNLTGVDIWKPALLRLPPSSPPPCPNTPTHSQCSGVRKPSSASERTQTSPRPQIPFETEEDIYSLALELTFNKRLGLHKKTIICLANPCIHVAHSAVTSNFKKTALLSRGQRKQMTIQIKRIPTTLTNQPITSFPHSRTWKKIAQSCCSNNTCANVALYGRPTNMEAAEPADMPRWKTEMYRINNKGMTSCCYWAGSGLIWIRNWLNSMSTVSLKHSMICVIHSEKYEGCTCEQNVESWSFNDLKLWGANRSWQSK